MMVNELLYIKRNAERNLKIKNRREIGFNLFKYRISLQLKTTEHCRILGKFHT
ncbi:unnamed protein product [Larinioides sclopetarius]|uniref:Uncharacterized protein n=1 Tax=Larinioides sclopetarius TaxID=280406 RepID=A0AAV2B090_9ARAC